MWQNKPDHYTIRGANIVMLAWLGMFTLLEFFVAIFAVTTGNLDMQGTLWAQMIVEVGMLAVVICMVQPVPAFKIYKPGLKNGVYSVLLGCFLSIALVPLLNFVVYLVETIHGSLPPTWTEDTFGALPFAVQVLFICIIAPFAEEFTFRGIVQNAYERKAGLAAVVIAAALFGALHSDPLSVANAFIAGLVMGYAYILTRSIWCPVLIHGVFNMLAITEWSHTYVTNLPWTLGLFPTDTATYGNTGYAVYNFGWAAVGILACWILLRALKKNNPGTSARRDPNYKPQAAQWAMLACVCVVLALRVVLVAWTYSWTM